MRNSILILKSTFGRFLCASPRLPIACAALLAMLAVQKASAFVLISNEYRLAKPEKTVVNIAEGACRSNGVSDAELKRAIEDSINRYWNTVTESQLKLEMGNEVARPINGFAEPGEVLIGCFPLSGASGVAYPNVQRGSATIHINSNSFVPGGYYYEGLVGVITHELGHAIGLGHSDDSASVMTYNSNGWSPSATHLSRDDKDGVIYLYPHDAQLAGLLGGCSLTAATPSPSEKPHWSLTLFNILAVAFPAALVLFLRRRRRILK